MRIRTDGGNLMKAQCKRTKKIKKPKQNIRRSWNCLLHCKLLLEIYVCPFFHLAFNVVFKSSACWVESSSFRGDLILKDLWQECLSAVVWMKQKKKNNKANYTVDIWASVIFKWLRTTFARAVKSWLHFEAIKDVTVTSFLNKKSTLNPIWQWLVNKG